MSQKKLTTAILGLGEKGLELLNSAYKSDLYEIKAVADTNTKLAEKISRQYECSWFDDYRQLIIQNQVDVLFVAAPVHQCDDFIREGMKKKFNIFKLIPPGLDFEEAAGLVRLAKKEKVHFLVTNTCRYSPGFCKLKEYLEKETDETIQLITAVCNVPKTLENDSERWLTDPQLAGGGVLLHNCYGLISQIVENFGIPQQVYSLSSNYAPDKQQRLRLTEDTAVVTMKFSDTLLGHLTASRLFGPEEQLLRLHSDKKYITVRNDSFTVCDNHGNVIEEYQSKSRHTEWTSQMLKTLGEGLLSPEKVNSLPAKDCELNNMAVIESAYLSARTATPEQPLKVLDMVNTEPMKLWNTSS